MMYRNPGQSGTLVDLPGIPLSVAFLPSFLLPFPSSLSRDRSGVHRRSLVLLAFHGNLSPFEVRLSVSPDNHGCCGGWLSSSNLDFQAGGYWFGLRLGWPWCSNDFETDELRWGLHPRPFV